MSQVPAVLRTPPLTPTSHRVVPHANTTTRSHAGYIDVEADEISPGYAVLLMYLMLVRGE